ncbi:threonine/serine dehydratase [Pelagibacteraceae bacterium]|nr:threonine/serine dehydratase [Pelagibacteraceae bacterium]
MNFSYKNIDTAHSQIKNQIIQTPLISNDYINKKLNSKVFFKLENLQNTGSFKLRGASYKISKISEENKKNGVVAYSSGNHAQAVAYASLKQKINCKIIMPKNAPTIKIENTKKYKAEVILYDPKTQSRESIGEKISIEENRTLIRPYDDIDIIAGQGTAGKEIYEQLMQSSIIPDIYLCCCGGGGLIAGTSTYLKEKFKNIKSFSVEPFGFDDTKKSLNSGKILSNEKGHQSICDAIITPQPGNLTFPINLKNLEDGIVVNDDEVKNSIKILAEHLKIIVEPGGAVAATAALTEKIDLNNKTVVVMISGGNIDLEMFRRL